MATTTFRHSPGVTFVFMLVIAYLSWVAVQAVLSLLIGRWPSAPAALVSPVVYAALFSAVWLFAHRKNWPWVRITDEALTLAEKRRVVTVPWSAVRSATVRRPGPFAVLEVAVEPNGVPPWASALQPLIRNGEPVYAVNVGLLRPGPSALRAALKR